MDKTAAPTAPAGNVLTGRLVKSDSGYLLLEVPNALVRGLYAALNVPGVELPLHQGRLNAHISVFRPEEVEQLGGADKVTEVGKQFNYRIGALRECNPYGWEGVDRVWMVSVVSPELAKLRVSYGLPPLPRKGRNELAFHITVAIRRKGVLRRSPMSKVSALIAGRLKLGI